MIIVTGAAGFIGSCLIGKLNQEGIIRIIAVDDFHSKQKEPNLYGKQISDKIDRKHFVSWFLQNAENIEFVFHIGARTDTTEFDIRVFNELNLDYSKNVFTLCTQYQIPLVYASSAATYGLGELGYKDDHVIVRSLKPLNPYGDSKNDFDKWVLEALETPPFWAGMKFFNVYGPNEYHKNRMASVIFHAEQQIKNNGFLKLFKSHHPDFEDGKQLRDFIYVLDLVDVIYWFIENQKHSGIYNLGTGKARTFLDLGISTFKALNLTPKIEFIETPIDIRDKYQYFTEANMSKLRNASYNNDFYPLEDGIEHYVKSFLKEKNIY